MINDEIFVDIKGYENLYKISNLGRVLSCEKRRGTNYSCIIPERVMCLTDNGLGYLQVILHKNCKTKCLYIQQLVAIHFISNPENKKEVNHIDGNKSNNRADNLEWNTRTENERHAYKTGLKGTGHLNKRSIPILKLNLENEIVDRFANSRLATESANTKSSLIKQCIRGLIPIAYGFKWVREYEYIKI